jgi:iron-sulfur cluster repair protein YtfE (RIC family)
MKLDIPPPLKAEHEELHARLAKATQVPGAVGAAAREVARLLHPHFVKEEAFALPPLGVLARVASGQVTPDMQNAVEMAQRLRGELPEMLAEHQAIVAALEKLRAAANAARLPEHERFAEALVQHAQTEEQVLYPAAILVGEHIRQALGKARP